MIIDGKLCPKCDTVIPEKDFEILDRGEITCCDICGKQLENDGPDNKCFDLEFNIDVCATCANKSLKEVLESVDIEAISAKRESYSLVIRRKCSFDDWVAGNPLPRRRGGE